MRAWVFPAGDEDERLTIARHRLLNASPPRAWSVDVNRKLVNVGDIAFLWQTGDASHLWRPGMWAAGIVYRYDSSLLDVLIRILTRPPFVI